MKTEQQERTGKDTIEKADEQEREVAGENRRKKYRGGRDMSGQIGAFSSKGEGVERPPYWQ